MIYYFVAFCIDFNLLIFLITVTLVFGSHEKAWKTNYCSSRVEYMKHKVRGDVRQDAKRRKDSDRVRNPKKRGRNNEKAGLRDAYLKSY